MKYKFEFGMQYINIFYFIMYLITILKIRKMQSKKNYLISSYKRLH